MFFFQLTPSLRGFQEVKGLAYRVPRVWVHEKILPGYMLSENTWFSCPKSSNNWEKLRCHACDTRTDERTVESSAVFCLSRIRKIVIYNMVKSPASKLKFWESDLHLLAGPAPIEEKGSLDQVLWQRIITIHNNHKRCNCDLWEGSLWSSGSWSPCWPSTRWRSSPWTSWCGDQSIHQLLTSSCGSLLIWMKKLEIDPNRVSWCAQSKNPYSVPSYGNLGARIPGPQLVFPRQLWYCVE